MIEPLCKCNNCNEVDEPVVEQVGVEITEYWGAVQTSPAYEWYCFHCGSDDVDEIEEEL